MTRSNYWGCTSRDAVFARRIIGKMLKSPMLEVVVRQDSSHLLHQVGELAPYAHRLRCLWGTMDTLMPESGRQALLEELGDHLVVEEVGHAPQQTRPGLVVREMSHLLSQLKTNRTARPSRRASASAR